MTKTISDCPCGMVHLMNDKAWQAYRSVTAGKSKTMLCGNVRGCWRVPRIFIACHGLSASLLAEQAEQYGWEKI